MARSSQARLRQLSSCSAACSCAAALPATEHALPVSSGRARTPDLATPLLPMPAMSIATLLQAAEYLDRRERGKLKDGEKRSQDAILALTDHVYPTWPRGPAADGDLISKFLIAEAEHGYATTLPSPGEEDFHQNNTSSTKNSTRLNKSTKKPQGNR